MNTQPFLRSRNAPDPGSGVSGCGIDGFVLLRFKNALEDIRESASLKLASKVGNNLKTILSVGFSVPADPETNDMAMCAFDEASTDGIYPRSRKSLLRILWAFLRKYRLLVLRAFRAAPLEALRTKSLRPLKKN